MTSNQRTSRYHLLEASWEVCNKVGGIYTVVTSKVLHAQEAAQAYFAVGPYLGSLQEGEFVEEPIPSSLQGVADSVRKEGVELHYGRWQIAGEPEVILVDWNKLAPRDNEMKERLWKAHQLDTLGSDFYDLDQPLLWSIAVGMIARAYARAFPDPVILHAHEWLSGGAILYDEPLPENLKTIFTTHATVLGRALSSRDIFIYDKLDQINPEDEARKYGVFSKHSIERLSANLATVFTTVSTITADEASAYLGRKPDIVTENGIDLSLFPAFTELMVRHTAMRSVWDDFVASFFFPSYRFDLSKTKYYFTMGRYEVHNKGYDLFFESLGELNKQLQHQNSDETIVALIMVPGSAQGVKDEVRLNQSHYNQLLHTISEYTIDKSRQLLNQYLDKREFNLTVDDETGEQLDAMAARFVEHDMPPLSPYNMPESDTFVQLAHQHRLDNQPHDRVKILLLPVYLDGSDGIFNIPLYDLVAGCDLGVFPSLYEPWGYTPMESVVLGVPAITSSVAGFGRAVATLEPGSEGSIVLDRSQAKPAEEASVLTNLLNLPLTESERQWTRRRMCAYRLSEEFSWDRLYERYRESYSKALESKSSKK